MDTFTTVFYYSYIAVSLFYIFSGVILLIQPNFIKHKFQSFFPLLNSFKYSNIINSVNLIAVGLLLLLIVKLLEDWSVIGLFFALTLSGLEVYLGFKFYYHEQKNVPQALIHIILHSIIVGVVIFFMVFYLSAEISMIKNQAASGLSSIYSWKDN